MINTLLIVNVMLKMFILKSGMYNVSVHIMGWLLILATSPWGSFKLWGGVVTTLDIDYSGPRLRGLLLRSLLIVPNPPSLPSVWCPASPDIALRPSTAQGHPSTRASPTVQWYQRTFTFLSLTRYYHIPTLPLLPHPHCACHIPVAASPTLLSKYLLEWSSAVSPQPPVAAMPHIMW